MDDGLFQSLKAKVLGANQPEFTYECQDCGTTFESTTAHMAEVACEACGSNHLRAVAD